jgi:hypothetical protein
VARVPKELGGVLAFLVVFGVIGAILLGVALGPWYAVALGLAVAIAVTIVAIRSARSSARAHPPASDAPKISIPDDGVHRILVVADERCSSAAVGEEIARHAASRPARFFVVSPALNTRLGHWTGDDADARSAAENRLQSVILSLAAAGLQAEGIVGDDDPLRATDDALRQFPASEIVFVTHAGDGSNWLEQGVVDLARGRYDRPVTSVVATPRST